MLLIYRLYGKYYNYQGENVPVQDCVRISEELMYNLPFSLSEPSPSYPRKHPLRTPPDFLVRNRCESSIQV
jgi:hypothetical protein